LVEGPPISSLLVRLLFIQKLPVDDIGFNNVMADLFHETDIGLSSVMEPTCYIEQVFSIKGSGLVSSGICLVIAHHIPESGDSRIDMALLGMALNPRNLDGSVAFNLHDGAEVRPQIPIVALAPGLSLLGILAKPNKSQQIVCFINECSRIRPDVDGPIRA